MASRAAAQLLQHACIVSPTAKHTATVIFLHGLGDTGDGWSSILSELKQPWVKLICPTAGVMPVSVNGGVRMPSWFDIYGLDKSAKQDEAGIRKAAGLVQELIDYEQEATGIPSNRIVVGGFSQGGSVAMFAALTYPRPLAGILALSSWLPLHESLEKQMPPVNKETPFLQCHGDSDPVVGHKWGVLSSQFVQSFNKSTYQFNTYNGLGHSSAPEELRDVQKWLDKVLPPVGSSNI